MATIKDVAAKANVSVTTVSIIINGKAEERKISEATVSRVMAAIAELNYQPNIAARKLRTFDNNRPNIAIYLAYDHRSHMFSQFVEAIYKEQAKGTLDFSITICPFKSGSLCDESTLTSATSFNAAIIAATSPADMEFLKENKPPFPVVLMNRSIKGMSSVCANIEASINELADMIQKKNCNRIATLLMKDAYMANKLRYQGFLSACKKRGISAPDEFIVLTDDSMAGGARAAEQLLKIPDMPRVLYCDTDSIAIGAVHTLNKAGIRIPEDLEILCICLSSPDYTAYSTPSITVVDVSLEKNMIDCLNLILDYLTNQCTEPVEKFYDAPILYRDSFPAV